MCVSRLHNSELPVLIVGIHLLNRQRVYGTKQRRPASGPRRAADYLTLRAVDQGVNTRI